MLLDQRGLALGGNRHRVTPVFSKVEAPDDPKAVGRYAYFSWYGQGAALFDLKNPRKPKFLMRYQPLPGRDRHGLLCPGDTCTAVWGVYVMPHYVLVSDLNSGLWVVNRPR